MYNVIKILAIALCSSAVLVSCTKSTERADSARDLLNHADSLRIQHDYNGAINLLDSVDKTYRDCIEERKAGTRIRIQTLIDLSKDSLNIGESRRDSRQDKIDKLSSKFITVSMDGTRGYKTIKNTFSGNEMDGSFIQPRIDDENFFYLAVNNAKKRLNLNAVEFEDTKASGQSIYMEGSEIMSLSQEKVSELVNAVTSTSSNNITIYLVGEKGRNPIKLTNKDIQAWRDTWYYAMLLQESRMDDIHYEKYMASIEKLQRQLDALNTELPNDNTDQ